MCTELCCLLDHYYQGSEKLAWIWPILLLPTIGFGRSLKETFKHITAVNT
jgi:hypothetical protein